MGTILFETYKYGDSPGLNSNSDASGDEVHGGKTKLFNFDPFSNMICSRVERARVDKGWLKIGLILD